MIKVLIVQFKLISQPNKLSGSNEQIYERLCSVHLPVPFSSYVTCRIWKMGKSFKKSTQ